MNLNAIRISLAKMLAKFSEIATDKAVLVKSDEGDFKVYDEVYVANEAGDYEMAPDGEYKTGDGKVIVVKDGKIESITDLYAEVDAEEQVPSPEGGKEPTVDAVEELRKEVNELYSLIDELIAKVKEIDERTIATNEVVDKMSKMPAAPSAEEIVDNKPAAKSFKEIAAEARKNFC